LPATLPLAPGTAGATATSSRRARSPFGPVAPTITAALVYATAAAAWIVTGSLPGGRWFAVHLFTLGVLTNLVLVFSEHFARTVTRAPDRRWAAVPVLANVGIVGTLAGVVQGQRWLLAGGSTLLVAAVMASWWRLRRMRHDAIGARFAWIVRTYERAHGAFVHGAVLGLLLGVNLLPGAWRAGGRLAHLHVTVLGWGGLTLLATLVFFGPTVVRTRIRDGADGRAARALRWGATGLTVGVVGLLLSGHDGLPNWVIALVAAGGLAAFAAAATIVLVPVARAAADAAPSVTQWPVIAVCAWFVLVVWADVVVVATGSFRYVDALGAALLQGVLAQSIGLTLAYLGPMLFGRTPADRQALIARIDRGGEARVAATNVGIVLLVAAAIGGTGLGVAGAWFARLGWLLVLGALAHQLTRTVRRRTASPQDATA